MTPEEITLRNRLLTGISLSYNRLIAKKQAENGELYFWQNGKVMEVEAGKIQPIDIKS